MTLLGDVHETSHMVVSILKVSYGYKVCALIVK